MRSELHICTGRPNLLCTKSRECAPGSEGVAGRVYFRRVGDTRSLSGAERGQPENHARRERGARLDRSAERHAKDDEVRGDRLRREQSSVRGKCVDRHPAQTYRERADERSNRELQGKHPDDERDVDDPAQRVQRGGLDDDRDGPVVREASARLDHADAALLDPDPTGDEEGAEDVVRDGEGVEGGFVVDDHLLVEVRQGLCGVDEEADPGGYQGASR